ncbi:MAG: hypothetical protein SOZ73_02510 [Campylobacter sp.]|nr:hypothetical protein [Campylobacter sp.]
MITITLKDSMNINFVNAIKSMLKAMPKNTYSIKETPKLTENGYTEEFENEILKIIAEHEKEKKKGKIKSFKNINDLNRALEN